MQKKTNDEIRTITNQVVEKALTIDNVSINKIILYGSYARGTADKESDTDIMVICDNDKDEVRMFEDAISKVIWDIGFNNDIVIQTVVSSKAFFDDWVDDLPYYRNVRDEGVVLYE